MPQPDPTAHLTDYAYISQYATDIVGLSVYIDGTLADPDSQSVLLTMEDQNSNIILNNVATTRASLGMYQYQLTSANTSVPAFYTFTWSFTVSSVAQTEQTFAQVGNADPAYDALPPTMKDIVETSWVRWSDQFDSPQGGPYLQTLFQTAFSRGRLAQLLNIALGRLNTQAQPFETFTLSSFPVAQWGPLLEQGLYLETINHLIRSYLEQPDPNGVSVSRLARRDYMDRYRELRQEVKVDYDQQMAVFKISMMGLGRPHILVHGGVYGSYGRTRLPISGAARGHFWSRAY